MVFLLFANTVIELGTFSILHVNMKLIQVGPGAGDSIADLMFRLIELPILLITTSNLLLHSNNVMKWGGVVGIVLFSLLVQEVLVRLGMLIFHHWNLLYSAIYLVAFIAFSRVIVSIIRKLSAQEALL